MFSGTKQSLLKTVANHQNPPSKEPLRLRKVFKTAIAVSKFQKFESDKFKKSIECVFDKTSAINELKAFYQQEKFFHLKESTKFAYYIRKFTITFDELTNIDPNLLGQFVESLKNFDENVDKNLQYLRCVSLKYLTRNSKQLKEDIPYSLVIDLIKRCHHKSIMTELAYTLILMTERSTLTNELIAELNSLLLNKSDIDEEVKGLLLARIEMSRTLQNNAQSKTEHRFITIGKSNENPNKNKLVVTKTIQTVKSTSNNKESEEAEMAALNLSNALKNRNRMLNMKITLESIDTIDDSNGDDRLMWRSTWAECLNLYNLVVIRGQALKSDDKDSYLPNKLFGWHVLSGTPIFARPFYSFFINRMIAATLHRASKKQQLNNNAIDKLMMCVTDLDSVIPAAVRSNQDMLDRFVDTIYLFHDEFKNLTEPDIAVNLIQTIISKTIEIVVHQGWLSNSSEKKKKSFDRAELTAVLRKQVNQLRLDSLNAIYNCSIRNKKVLTGDRLKKIHKCLTNSQENDADFTRLIFRLMSIADSTNEIDYKATFDTYVDILLRGTSTNVEMIICYLSNQAKDVNRSQKLFTNAVLSKLIGLLNTSVSSQIKEDVMEIINTYLEHEVSKPLEDEYLELIIQYVLKPMSLSPKLSNSALTTMLIIAEKPKSLSDRMVNILIDYMKRFGENSSNYVIVILSRVIQEENPLENEKALEKISSNLDSDDVVQLDTDSKITFTKRSEQNQHANQISLLAANLIFLSVREGVPITSKTIETLVLALSNKDKQTKIVASKCIYSLSLYTRLENDILSQMKDFLRDAIYDVSVYILAAYSYGLIGLAKQNEPIHGIHMMDLSSLFLTQSLKLGEIDFTDAINVNLLEVFKFEARKQKFDDSNVFVLFDSILSLNEKYSIEILDILEIYTSSYRIPSSTIQALETALALPEQSEKAMFIFQNLIRHGQAVTTKILQNLADNLYMSINARRRYNSFKFLEKARKNQDLPESIFFQIELVKAGFTLSRANKIDSILKFMKDQTNNGIRLPIDTIIALEKQIDHEDALQVLYNISKNKQIIQYDLLNKLIDKFDSAADQKILVGIFENVTKNNQILSRKLLEKLELALTQKQIEGQILSIFVYLAQKGEKLSDNIIQKILAEILSARDLMLKQELLSALGSLIQTHHTDIQRYKQKIEQILLTEIKSESIHLQKLCLDILRILAQFVEIDSNLFEMIITIGTNFHCDQTIKYEIYSLFLFLEKSILNKQLASKYTAKVQLANLNYRSNRELLCHLKVYANHQDGLLEENYHELKTIIDQDPQLQEEALGILHLSKSKRQITDALIESLVLLYESTQSKEIKNSCSKLLEDVHASGKSLHDRAAEIIYEKHRNEKSNEIKQAFARSTLYQQLHVQFQFNEKQIQELVKVLELKTNILEINNIEELIQISIHSDAFYYTNPAFVLLIERVLLTQPCDELTLQCYCRIIKEKKSQNIEKVLDKLVETCDETSLLPLVIESVYYALKFSHLSERCMRFLENNLNADDRLIRSFAFKGLRMILNKDKTKKSERFQTWCDLTIKNLSNAGIELKEVQWYMDILEIIFSLEFIDLNVMKKHVKEDWTRELLISSLFAHFKASQTEQIEFYSHWFQLVEKSVELLSIIMQRIQHYQSLTVIIDMFTYIRRRPYADVMIILNNHESPADKFKEDWSMEMIKGRLINKDLDENYLNRLCQNVCASLKMNFIEKLFKHISRIDNLREFEDVIKFCSIKPPNLIDLDFITVDDSPLKSLLEANNLCNQIRFDGEKENSRDILFKNFCLLIRKKWTFDQLDELTNSFNTSHSNRKVQNLIDILELLNQYNISSSQSKKTSQLVRDSTNFTELLRGLNQVVIENNFQSKGKVKSPTELLIELEEINKDHPNLVKYIRSELLKELEEIKRKDLKSLIESPELSITKWDIKQINFWAKAIKKINKKPFSNVEAIAVIRRANFLFTGYLLTDTQILCSLIALKTDSNSRGKLLQVATGEGKSTIVCILAIIHALTNKQVHVITSSPVLAERDSKEKLKLFKMFHLTCSDNNDKTVYLYGRKDCYKSDIVYGEVSQFQFDKLRDEYSKLGTLGERKLEIAIVDEVDSMLIDDSSKIARLSSTAAGMDFFQVVYVYIWQRLLMTKERFIMFNGKMYLIYGKVGFENGKIVLEYSDENDNIVKIPDLEGYVSSNKDISRIGQIIDGDLDKYLKDSLDEYLTNLIQEKKLEIPKNYEQFYAAQKSKWISNAIEALNYQENIHYIVQEGQIKPVDYYSTGIVQSSTNWSDGLHQFLQIKHNLKMTSETFTTNFLSNIGFINNYKNIYGLTGTLGSDKAKKVLREVYSVELVNIPPTRRKQYLELEPIVVGNEIQWLETICSTVLIETKKNRGTLIICENIAHANRLGELLKVRHRSTAIKLYTMNNMNQERHVEKILPGEIIIATNLAGRGTDIRTDDIEDFGGLHVILTFMPNNQRVEDQAFGRTARQGKRGTGLMILNSGSSIGQNNGITTEVKLQRDLIEAKLLDEFRNNELRLIQIKDRLFKEFCRFLNEEIRQDIRNQQGFVQKTVELFTNVMPTVYETNILAAVEEQWAMFLRKLDDQLIKLEHAEGECRKLIELLRKDYKEGRIIKNSYYHTVIANDIIMKEWSIHDTPKAKRALVHFEAAIQLDETSSGSAYLGIAWCLLIIQEENYKKKALSSLEKALKILSNDMAMLNSIQVILEQKQPAFTGSELYKQLATKATILGTYLNSIQSNIGAIKKSLRFIDLIETKLESSGDVLEKVEYHHELERNSKQKLEIKLEKKSAYTLVFNDLTSREDSGTIDQALITINNAYNEEKLSPSYQEISLTLKQIELDRIKALFNKNKEFFDLTKVSAIEKLKSERTFWNTCRLTSFYPIDLQIIHSDNKTEEFKDQQINALLTLIESKTDETLRFNITIKNANVNEVNKYFQNPNSVFVSLQVDFDRLDMESINEKLASIRTQSMNIEMVATKSILLAMLDRNKYINTAKVAVSDEKPIYQKVTRNELLNRINRLKNDDSHFYIKFEALEVEQVKTIINGCQDMSFNVSFLGIDFYQSIKGLNGQANFHFNNLNKTISKILIPDLRKENMEFSLTFQKLNEYQVEHIVSFANLDQEHMQKNKVKSIMELYSKGSMPTLELNEFIARGIEYMIEINEKRFVPWRSVITVAVLGSLQIIAGGVLIATGFGASVGMGLITEGIADMFTAYRAYSNRQFCWGDYCKQKAVSLAISAVSMGYSKLKDAGKGMKNVVQSVGTEALEQAGTQFATNAKTVGQTMVQTGKNLKSLAFKYSSVKMGEAVVREGLNSGVQYLSTFSFDLIKPQISESVQSRIQVIFAKSDLIRLLRKMYALDLKTNSKILQCKIDQIVADTINPRHDFARRQWDSIGGPLLKGILADSKNYGSAISMALRIIGTLNGLHTVGTLIENVYAELVKKLTQIDRITMTFTLVLHQNIKNMDKERARTAASDLRALDIIDQNDNLKISSEENVNADCLKLKTKIHASSKDKAVAKFMETFCDSYMQVEFDSFSIISKSVADKITEQLIQIIESQLIQPWSTLAVSSITSSLSNRVQHHYLVDKNQNSESQKKDQEKYDQLKDKKDLTEEEKIFMKNYGKYRTFAEQINYNSRDYCLAYTQCESAYYASLSEATKKGEKVDEKVQERADGVRGSQPATMSEMSALFKKYGINAKVVNDENYQRTQEEIDNGVVIVYVEKGSQDANNVDQVGHAYYVDTNGNRFDIETKPQDCFYGVFSKILETNGMNKSIETIRYELADYIESNPYYSTSMAAERWICERYPYEANSLIFCAGLRLVPSKTYRRDQGIYDQLQEKRRTENLTEDEEKFIEGHEKQKQNQEKYEELKAKERHEENLSADEKKFIEDYQDAGYLEVEPIDLEKLNKSVHTTKDRGWPYDKWFKAAVAQGECPTPRKESSYHHIIPNNQLKNLVPSEDLRTEERIKTLEEHVNRPNVRSIIIDNDLTNPNNNHGEVIHASIANYPNNLVYGPNPGHRCNDPGRNKDTELLNAQTSDYQIAVGAYENNPSLQTLGNMPPSKPVTWVKDDTPNKKGNDQYYVKKEVMGSEPNFA